MNATKLARLEDLLSHNLGNFVSSVARWRHGGDGTPVALRS